MDRVLFVQNIKEMCQQRNIAPTVACRESGVGTSFINDIERGKTPSVAKVQQFATYLGVTTSELLGETKLPQNIKGAATPKDDGPAEEDARLLNLLRKADPDLKKAMIAFLEKAQK